MSLFYQHNINEQTRLGIWKIEEPLSFFLDRVPLNSEVTHPHKTLQHLAGRLLLLTLFPDFPVEEIMIADTRKPFLEKEQFHFSISHCGDFAAAIVSRESRVGIDIERITGKIERVQHKFTTEPETALMETVAASFPGGLPPGPALPTMIWSAKEAIYKWYGYGKLDFRTHMVLSAAPQLDEAGWMELPFHFLKEEPAMLNLYARFLDDMALVWVLGS